MNKLNKFLKKLKSYMQKSILDTLHGVRNRTINTRTCLTSEPAGIATAGKTSVMEQKNKTKGTLVHEPEPLYITLIVVDFKLLFH